MPKLTILVGPAGSGKTTFAKKLIENDGDHGAATVRVSQDEQGKFGHMEIFREAVRNNKDIIVDRMGFSVEQRHNYMVQVADDPNYEIEIIVLHQSYKTCLERMLKREGHPTIQDEKSARSALQTFFTKYERPYENPRFKLTFLYPETLKPKCVVVDLDGTLANCDHRRHHVRRTDGLKKDWKAFFADIPDDPVNQWCANIIRCMESKYKIVLCTGRDSNQQRNTVEWLKKNEISYDDLFMRDRNDSRQDFVTKEVILDFEILTRYNPIMFIDDRQQVIDLWRRRGFVALQCDVGDF